MDTEAKRLIKDHYKFLNQNGKSKPAGVIMFPSALKFWRSQPRMRWSKHMPEATRRALESAETDELGANEEASQLSLVSDPPAQRKANARVHKSEQRLADLINHIAKIYYPNGDITLL